MTEQRGPRPPQLPASAAQPIPDASDQVVELSAISGGLAHEVRNALSTLRMNLQLLDEDWGEADMEEAAALHRDMIRRSRQRIGTLLTESKRLETILDDFLQFISKRELNRRPADLTQLITQLIDFYRPQAETHDINISVLAQGESLVCDLDDSLMKQALLNLLVNAQQAMESGGDLMIHLRALTDETARIDIIDTGPGIPAEQVPRIFQAYYSTRKRGTGLGLTTTRKIIREHGGRIHVHSEPGQGTCFTILLPRVAPPDRPGQAD